MDKVRRTLAMIGVIVIVICAILTLIFALLTNFGVGDFSNAWKASAWCMVVMATATIFLFNLIFTSRFYVINTTLKKPR